MVNIPYDKIVEKIKEKTGISEEEINSKVEDKLKQLSGLISREGAGHIVANELKVKLVEMGPNGKVKIKDILPGMKNIELDGKIITIYDVREFQVGERKGKVGNIFVGDETGKTRIVMWGSTSDIIANLKKDDIVKIINGYVKKNNEYNEVHLNDNSKVVINPADVKIELQEFQREYTRKNLKEINGGERIETLSIVVQVFDPRFFEICPNCQKRVKEKEGQFVCDTHGAITPSYAYLINFVVDDGTDTTRVVCFREKAEELTGLDNKQFLELREKKEFEGIKNMIIGNQYLFSGRVRKNEMFDRNELIVEEINKPDPNKELERIENSG